MLDSTESQLKPKSNLVVRAQLAAGAWTGTTNKNIEFITGNASSLNGAVGFQDLWPDYVPDAFQISRITFYTCRGISGVASLDLMLGHTFYNRPCLATSMLVHTCIYIWLLSKKCTA